MSDLFVSINSEDEIYDLAEIDSDVVIGNLLGDIKKLQAENAELQDKLEDEGFVLVMGRDDVEELENLRKEIAELKKQSQWISVDDFETHLSDNDFCFVYFPCGAIKKCYLNDYRTYSGKGVYWQDMSGDDLPMLNTKFIKVDIPTPPEGE